VAHKYGAQEHWGVAEYCSDDGLSVSTNVFIRGKLKRQVQQSDEEKLTTGITLAYRSTVQLMTAEGVVRSVLHLQQSSVELEVDGAC